MISKHCSWCDHQFDTKIKYQIYCSAQCREAATKEKINERYIRERTQKRAKKKRYCSSCNTLLSMYNDSTTCQSCDVDKSIVNKILKDMKGLSDGKS
jgi:hypothetical protein